MGEQATTHLSWLPALRSIVLRWERLRILYNLVLLGLVLVPTGGSFQLPSLRELPVLAIGAVLANLCFMAGPVAEVYMSWLGLRSRWVTAGLFAGGLLVSIPCVYMFGFAYVLSVS
jgi:hypothetical protein